MTFVFLDFDGVTHAFFPRGDASDSKNAHFAWLPRIEAVVREFPQVKIVISSSWRESHSLDELRRHFTPDIRERGSAWHRCFRWIRAGLAAASARWRLGCWRTIVWMRNGLRWMTSQRTTWRMRH